MSRIIFTSRYIKNSTHSANLVHYIATRDGVETPKIFDPSRPATINQKKLIAEIINAAPEVMGCFEYEDYRASPTIGNASELISAAFESTPTLWNGVRNFVEYIAKRPGAERSRLSGHGLWNGSDKKIVLSQAMDEVANHQGNLWTHIVSLRREDAERMGYANADAWRELVRSKIPVIAEAMKIPLDELRWYAAFHNAAHHPHIHLIVYSQNSTYGYLTEPGIEKMRATFGTTIFQNELLHIYERKDRARTLVNEFANDRMRELARQVENGGGDPAIAEMLSTLAEKLKQTTGKKQYGYLKPELKRLVNDIVEQLAADQRIDEMYRRWCDLTAEVKRFYTSDIPAPPPLAEEKSFKTIKNMVIRQALELNAQIPEMQTPPPSMPVPETQIQQQPAPLHIHGAGALLRSLARLLNDDYQQQRKNYEQAVDSKLMQKIRRKKQDLGQRFE